MTCAILSEQYTQATIAHEAPHRIDRWPPTFPKEGYPFDMHAAAPSHIMHHDVESKIEVMLEDLVTGLETISFILCSMGGRAERAPAILSKSCHARSPTRGSRNRSCGELLNTAFQTSSGCFTGVIPAA